MTVVDMSQFIAARSDQLNADDLLDSPRTITITKVTAAPDATEQPVSIHYEGDQGKPFKPCKTVRRIMVGVWGAEASKYVGRSMTLYRDPTVAFGGMQVGGIRVSHMSHIDEKKTVALMVTRGRKAPFSVLPLKDVPAPPPAANDPAAKWAAAFIAKLATLPDRAAVDAFEAEKGKKLEELRTARPDLHEAAAAALELRKSALAPAASDTFEGDDLIADTPRGDATTGENMAAEAVDKVLAQAKATSTSEELEKLIKDTEAHKVFLPEDVQTRLEIGFDKERRRLAQPIAAE